MLLKITKAQLLAFVSMFVLFIRLKKFSFDLPFCDQLFAALVEELKLIFPDLNHCLVGAGHVKQHEMPLVITIVTSEKA